MTFEDDLDLDRLARDSLHFRRRVVVLAPGEELTIDAAAWRDAIVFLQAGEVELECVAGVRCRFAPGAMLCLMPPVSLLRNCGDDSARLIAISRRNRESATRTG